MDTFLKLLHEYKNSSISESINYEQMNEILISHHSTAIEGSSLTEDETRMLLTEGTTVNGKPLEHHNMALDHHKALLWVLAKAKMKTAITSQFIQEISASVLRTTGSIIHAAAGSYDPSKGEFRKSNVFVGTRYFMSYQKVENAVKELADSLNVKNQMVKTEKEIYDLAFDAHFLLVSIHPFADGNGRTSRLLMNYILAYHHQPLALIYQQDKLEYYKALEKSREDDVVNLKPIRDFMYAEQIKYFQEELNTYKSRDKNINYTLPNS
jgi:Fic family protein